MKKRLAIIVFLVVALAALWVTPAMAAQGQITEVNPSGRINVVDGITDVGVIELKEAEVNDKGSKGGKTTESTGSR